MSLSHPLLVHAIAHTIAIGTPVSVYCCASSEMSDAAIAVHPNCSSAQHSKVTHSLHKNLAWPLFLCHCSRHSILKTTPGHQFTSTQCTAASISATHSNHFHIHRANLQQTRISNPAFCYWGVRTHVTSHSFFKIYHCGRKCSKCAYWTVCISILSRSFIFLPI